MDGETKLPLKRVELSLTKFNEVAIPHHLDLLRQHRTNIIKYEESGEWARARSEQIHARRVASQLRGLLRELEALRARVLPADLARFDALTQRARDTTLKAIVEYLGLIESSCRSLVAGSGRRSGKGTGGDCRAGTSPLSINRSVPEPGAGASAASTESVGVVAHASPVALALAHVELRCDEQEASLRAREELLRGWAELQAEVRALHDVWQTAQAAALAQREAVERAGARVGEAAAHVGEARAQLASAERLRAGAWGAGGAAAGALLGGPVGLAVGAKAGALAAAAGSLLGYLGARLLGGRASAPPKED